PAPRRRLREPLPDREGERLRLYAGRRRGRDAARRAGGGRDRERAALRIRNALAAAARGAERDRKRARGGDRAQAAAGADRAGAPRPDRRTARDDRAAGGRGGAADRGGGRRG